MAKKIARLVKRNGVLVPRQATKFNRFKTYRPSKKAVTVAPVKLPEVDWNFKNKDND